MESNHTLPIGWHVGKYELTGVLSHQNFYTTYRAYDPQLKREVVIREFLPLDLAVRTPDGIHVIPWCLENEQPFFMARERFLDHARALSALQHPSILSVCDVLEKNGTAYQVTPFMEGETLDDWLSRHPVPEERELCRLLHSLLWALAVMHAAGRLHQNITPSNIFMDRNSGQPVLLGLDSLGWFKNLQTRPLSITVTPHFSPIEQYQTHGRLGPWTDLYSLGGVLYSAVTGRQPPTATSRLCENPPLPLPGLSASKGCSPAFLAMIEKAMQSRAADRWQSAAEWLRALHQHLSPLPPVAASAPSGLRRVMSAMFGAERSPKNATGASSR